MICENPFVGNGGQAYGCGQCLPCRLNRRRIWTHRIMLEAGLHGDNCFITLTYDDGSVPHDGSVSPKHLQDWLKRFRKSVAPRRIRFFAVGEYGDATWRPHYHVAVFGYPMCSRGMLQFYGRACGCSACSGVRDSWGMGHILVGSLGIESAQYIAGYVTKKMTVKDDARLQGRHPEFARMSRRPGIGAGATDKIAEVFNQFNLADRKADVPSALRHGKRLMPLGRYMRGRVREVVYGDKKVRQGTMDELSRQMFDLRMAARSDTENPSLKYHVVESQKGAVAGAKSRFNLRKKRGML